MVIKVDGLCYISMVHSGIKNLEIHLDILNKSNVFPVPDGDTGTNMVATLKYGYESINNQGASLADISKRFSSSAVMGAMGNSGVIVSQFFKGISESFKDIEIADCESFANALKEGCNYAYAAVSRPIEGTMLTVLKDASSAVINSLPFSSINELIDVFLEEAKNSLARTPDLLPILKEVNVVDSGGFGILYFFEGIKKYLDGEMLQDAEKVVDNEHIDFSLFNKDTTFLEGYCVEGVVQLNMDIQCFNYATFRSDLANYGDSIATSLEEDKVKLHIHTKIPGLLIDHCQKYGEFLRIKITNMSVQKTQSNKPIMVRKQF